MIAKSRYTVMLELEPEDVLVLTTIIQVFRDTSKTLEMEVPDEFRERLMGILSRLAFELHEVLGENH